jgi:large subunit ribosomal protein L20
MSYSQLIHGLRVAEIDLDRKILADLAVTEPEIFAGIVVQAENALGANPVESRVSVERKPEAAAEKPDTEAAPAVAEAPDTKEQPEVEAAERRAEELGVDLSAVEGTGQEGRITLGDVEKASKDGEDG